MTYCVSLANSSDRVAGTRSALRVLGINPVKNKDVLVKPNFNTADPAPGSTHNDTLLSLVDELWAMGAKSICLGERSYPVTRQVMDDKGILPHLQRKDVQILDFDELPESDWVNVDTTNAHWPNGLRIARPILEAECLVSAGCLKTHQFGGVITMSLKLHVGVVPTHRNGFSFMSDLHQSPYQQEMIAEINAHFAPQIVLLDGVEAFVDGGPATGKRVTADVVLASDDRVAIDAVGVAVLKHLGSNADVMQTRIFDQRQIARAAALGIGADSAAEIELIAADDTSRTYRDRIQEILAQG